MKPAVYLKGILFLAMTLIALPQTVLAGEPNSRITSISNPSILEGDAGTQLLQFEILCDPCDLRVTATVNWRLDDDTATAGGNDYVDSSGNFQVTGGNGPETHFVDVVINGDTTPEPDEQFFLVLFNPSVGSPSFFIDDDTGVGTIENDDIAQPDIQITSSESTDPLTAGSGNLTYVVTATNVGSADATGVEVSSTVLSPAGVSVDSATPSGTGSWSNVFPGTWTIGNLGMGNSETLTFVLSAAANTAAGTDTIDLSASLSALNETDNNDLNDATSQMTSVARSADLSISKVDDPDPAVAGNDVTYTITVDNAGPSDASAVVVTDNLPAGLTFVSTSGCDNDPNGAPTCNLGTIAAGDNQQYTITATLDADLAADSQLSNTASVEAAEPDPQENNDSATQATVVNREVDLEMAKECTDEVVAGSSANNYSCTLTVTNNGPSQASGVAVADSLAAITGVSDGVAGTPSQGSAAIVAGQLDWDVGVIDSGNNATLTFTRTVSLQAAEGTPLITNVATASGTETDTDGGNDSATDTTNVRWPTATFRVLKEYASGGAGPVDVTLTCTDATGLLEYAPQMGTTTTSLTVRRFDNDPAGSGTSCTITEEVPAGYFEADRTADCDVDPTADQGAYECTLTNAVSRATFKVTKIFADGNDVDEVLVSIDCNTGLILDQDKLLSDDEEVEFVVTSFTEGSLICTITEDGETGYSGEYANLTITGAPVVSDESCFYAAEEIVGDSAHECVITNYPDPVDVKVTKEWVYEGSTTLEVSTYYTLTLFCDAYIDGGYKIGGGMNSPAGNGIGPGCGLIKPLPVDGPQGSNGVYYSWCKAFPGNGVGMFTGSVTPEFPDSHCKWVETRQDQAIEVDQSDCQSLTISAGNGASCTIINTVFFEGIPTLSQYGMAILALLMLAVGFVSFRRFS